MKAVNISDLRANLLKYLEKASHGESISITTNGKPLATITAPLNQKALARKHLKKLASTAKIHDVTRPVQTEWNAAK